MSKPLELREADFRREIEKYLYPAELKKEFLDYWSEPDRAPQPKMRYEKEKTWDLGRRLARWARTSKTVLPAAIVHRDSKPAPPRIENDFDRLDAFIDEMRRPGIVKDFSEFGRWYDFMKENKLLMRMTQKEIDDFLKIYEGDKAKCRCAAVQQTLCHYVIHELRINDIINARARLISENR